MCGIWFSNGFEFTDRNIDLVRHRGPDGIQIKRFSDRDDGPVAAHARLAVVDLDHRSDQPMSDPSKRFWLNYNGQIYNYVELREELETLGHRFLTSGDTEVVLQSYLQWGSDCLAHLQGMFAFVIFDKETNQVFAARDRFGIKPLYISRSHGKIAFASEIKQFTALPSFRFAANKRRALDYLATGLSDHSEETMFQNVISMPAAHFATFDLAKPQDAKFRRWYRFQTKADSYRDLNEAFEDLSQLWRRTIELHLRSDVPIGGCLSAGIDSSCIAATVSKYRMNLISEPHFITAASAETGVDEGKDAGEFARALGVDQSCVLPTLEQLHHQFDRLVWLQDEPFGSTSIFSQSRIFSEARDQGLKVMLDGQGADEIAGGYYVFFGRHLLHLFREARLPEAIATMKYRSNSLNISAVSQLIAAIAPQLPKSIWKRIQNNRLPNWVDHTHDNRRPSDFSEFRTHLIEKSMLPALLHWEDRNSMAFGIEARVPYLHHPIAEFFQSLPTHLLYEQGKSKALIRRLGKSMLDHPVFHSDRKLGFTTPEEKWLRQLAMMDLEPDFSELGDFLGPELKHNRLEAQWNAMKTGSPDVDQTGLFRALCLSRWMKVFGTGVP